VPRCSMAWMSAYGYLYLMNTIISLPVYTISVVPVQTGYRMVMVHEAGIANLLSIDMIYNAPVHNLDQKYLPFLCYQ
jgi:hypothetical protein